jgi:hypothetical protein
MLPLWHCGFGRLRLACPLEPPGGGRWRLDRRNKSCLPALTIFLGLAAFSTVSFAQEQLRALGLSNALDLRTQAPFYIWRTTTLGSYKGVNAYRDALDAANIKIGDAADEILGRPAFPYAREKTVVELAIVSAAELGLESESSLADFYNRARRLGLMLCPAEVALQLRLDYRNQPLGEALTIAMEPVNTYAGEPTILSLVNWGTGLALLAGTGRSDFMVPPSVRFVFAFPERVAAE